MELNQDFLEFIDITKEDLIRNKIASGRPKDQIDVIELERKD
jgi:hypothetical protein